MESTTKDASDQPLPKRQKVIAYTDAKYKSRLPSGSRIFSPFKTVGLVSQTAVPFTSVRLGKDTFQITTSVGYSLQTYDLRRGLNQIFVTYPDTPELITAIHGWRDRVFAAWGGLHCGSSAGVWVFKRGKKTAELESPPGVLGSLIQLLIFGSWIVGCCGKGIQVWKSASYQHYSTVNVPSRDCPGGPIFTGQMCTMPTYLNKVFVGRCDGNVDIWNLSSGKLIYSFSPTFTDSGAVTALQPTPALGFIAIAYKNGHLAIHNVDMDQTVVSLKFASKLPIISIAFQGNCLGTGEEWKPGVMATASLASGDITMWDLGNGGKITGVIRRAHQMSHEGSGSGINRVEFLDGQPVMISSGKDNSLKSWIFSGFPFSPIPKPLHSRSGHSAPVTVLKFLPSPSDMSEDVGKWLLSASKDSSLRGLSLRNDRQAIEISQGNERSKANANHKVHLGVESKIKPEGLRAPEITCLACSLAQDKGTGSTIAGPIWANLRSLPPGTGDMAGLESVITGHRGDKYARTWFWGRKRAGRWAFETADGAEVKSVAMSPCGTFALIGSAAGSIDMFNLQSGMHRRSFPARVPSIQDRRSKTQQGSVVADNKHGRGVNSGEKHTKEVTGLMVDSLNQKVVSCGLDGKVKFWDFSSGRLIGEIDRSLTTAITGLRYSSSSELAAFSCDDLSIRVADVETRKIVRELSGCIGQINDFCFSSNGRWVLAASMDSVIRVWDLPTGHLIDAFRVASTCTTLDFSPTGEFLATAHADSVGISIWSNRSLFTSVPQRNLGEDDITEAVICRRSLPAMIEVAFVDEPESDKSEQLVFSPEQLDKDLMTLSIVPRTTWHTLLQLDLIKASLEERNRPKEPPKPPEKPPFFLPSLIDRKEQDLTITIKDMNLRPTPQALIVETQQPKATTIGYSQVSSLLEIGARSGDFTPFIEYLRSLSPAKADLEIRSLDIRLRGDRCELADFVTALTKRLRTKKDFELINTWMAVFLKLHADVVRSYWEAEADERDALKMLHDALRSWRAEQQREAKRLTELVGYCRGMISFLRAT